VAGSVTKYSRCFRTGRKITPDVGTRVAPRKTPANWQDEDEEEDEGFDSVNDYDDFDMSEYDEHDEDDEDENEESDHENVEREGDIETYEGDLVNALRHGKGTLITSRSTYRGMFEKDRKHGYGTETFSGGFEQKYEGGYREGRRHGRGKLTYRDESYLSAVWDYGKIKKHAVYEDTTGERYVQSYKNAKFFSGFGIKRFTYDGSEYYKGPVVCTQMHGRGKFVDAEGYASVGDFVKSIPIGAFQLLDKDGIQIGGRIYNSKGQKIYEGGMVDRKKTGRGVLETDELTYRGSFINDEFHGRGTAQYHDNAQTVYEGYWRNGCKHGQGTLSNRWVTMIGTFEGDRLHGHGTLTCKVTNAVYEGPFVHGKRQGTAKYRLLDDKNNQEHEVEYQDDMIYRGFAKAAMHPYPYNPVKDSLTYMLKSVSDCNEAEDIFLVGTFEEFKRHGYCRINRPDGSYEIGEFDRNIPVGEHINYNSAGQPISTKQYSRIEVRYQ
jgi:hypothetical protein